MPLLHQLYLDDTKVTDAGLIHLTGLQRLSILSLRHTRVTDAGIAALTLWLPNLKVIR